MVKDIPGHIIELGVGAGRNAILFGRMLEFEGQDINARYIGFDTFSSYTPRDLEQNPQLDKNKWSNNSLDYVLDRIDQHGLSTVSYFVPVTSGKHYLQLRKVSAIDFQQIQFTQDLFIDVSAYEPSMIGLQTLQ